QLWFFVVQTWPFLPRLPNLNLHPFFLFALYLVFPNYQLHHLIVILIGHSSEAIQNTLGYVIHIHPPPYVYVQDDRHRFTCWLASVALGYPPHQLLVFLRLWWRVDI